jgi:curved DNA-binding protein CbpA
MSPATASDDERRRRRRALILAHHPDRGGDPAEFVRLLQLFEDDTAPEEHYPEVRFAHRPRWWQQALLTPVRRCGRRPRRVL